MLHLLHSDYQIDSRQLEWGWGVERSCGKKRCRCSCSLPPEPIVGAGADAAFVLSLNDDDHDHDHDGGGRYYGARFENWCMIMLVFFTLFCWRGRWWKWLFLNSLLANLLLSLRKKTIYGFRANIYLRRNMALILFDHVLPSYELFASVMILK